MNLQAQTRGGANQQVDIDKFPDYCPICLQGIQPLDTGQHFVGEPWLEVVFRCPRLQCEHFFLGRYNLKRRAGLTSACYLQRCSAHDTDRDTNRSHTNHLSGFRGCA